MHFRIRGLPAEKFAPLFALSDASDVDLGLGGLRRGTVAGSFIHLIDRHN